MNAIGKKAYPVELLFRDGPDFILQVVEFTVVVVGVSLVGSGIVQAYAQLGNPRQDVTELALGGILSLEERDPILDVFRDGEGSGDGGFQLGGNGQSTGVSSLFHLYAGGKASQALGQPGAGVIQKADRLAGLAEGVHVHTMPERDAGAFFSF